MDPTRLRQLLEEVALGRLSPAQAMEHLRALPYEDLGFARVDHHRHLRKGFPEVIYGEGKTPEQIAEIAKAIHSRGSAVLATRVDQPKANATMALVPGMTYHPQARCLTMPGASPPPPGRKGVAVVAAGTSDLPVAMEAVVTAELMGSRVEKIFDVGVSGLHRLWHEQQRLKNVSCCVVVAGMEGALPSVVGGIVDVPVVAVPTSVGYGSSFGGLAALLGMLNSCAPGLCVVNIDNGFGGGYLGGLIDHLK